MTNRWPDSPRTGRNSNKNKIINEKGEISTDSAEIQKTVREYYEQSCANKSDNLEKTDNFLETYSPPKLNQEERLSIEQTNH